VASGVWIEKALFQIEAILTAEITVGRSGLDE
jgi:hypothetical protein